MKKYFIVCSTDHYHAATNPKFDNPYYLPFGEDTGSRRSVALAQYNSLKDAQRALTDYFIHQAGTGYYNWGLNVQFCERNPEAAGYIQASTTGKDGRRHFVDDVYTYSIEIVEEGMPTPKLMQLLKSVGYNDSGWDYPFTMSDFADVINSCKEWELVFNDINEEMGWKDESGEEFGIRSNGKERLYFNENGEAVTAYIDISEMGNAKLLQILSSFDLNVIDAEIKSIQQVEENALFIKAEVGILRKYGEQKLDLAFVYYDGEDWIFTPDDWQGYMPEKLSDIADINWRVNNTQKMGVILYGLPRLF